MKKTLTMSHSPLASPTSLTGGAALSKESVGDITSTGMSEGRMEIDSPKANRKSKKLKKKLLPKLKKGTLVSKAPLETNPDGGGNNHVTESNNQSQGSNGKSNALGKSHTVGSEDKRPSTRTDDSGRVSSSLSGRGLPGLGSGSAKASVPASQHSSRHALKERLLKAIESATDLLEKAGHWEGSHVPSQEGQEHPDGQRVAKLHPNGNLAWHLSSSMSRRMDEGIDHGKASFMASQPKEIHAALNHVITSVRKDPNRHFTIGSDHPKEDVPVLRGRHMRNMLEGRKNDKGQHSVRAEHVGNGLALISAERHGSRGQQGSRWDHWFVHPSKGVQYIGKSDDGNLSFGKSESQGKSIAKSLLARIKAKTGTTSAMRECDELEKIEKQAGEKTVDNDTVARHWHKVENGDDNLSAMDDYHDMVEETGHKKWKLTSLPVDSIKAHHSGYGKDSEEMTQNYADRKKQGSDFPAIIVKPHPRRPGLFRTVDGQHRLKAAKAAGVSHIQAYVPVDKKS